jgi:hypothetical protein
MLLFLGVLPRWLHSVPWPLALCCHPSVFTCSSSSDTFPDTPVYSDATHTSTYSKLQERLDKYDQFAPLVWDVLDERFKHKELDTIHTFIDRKPGAPSVHFVFRRLMPRLRYEGIIKIFKGREGDHKTLVTEWSDISERQYARTFQRRHPTREQTVQEGRILEGAQFCVGYREEEGGFDTYWAQVVRSDWIRNNVASPR